jgi:hypothetical protein
VASIDGLVPIWIDVSCYDSYKEVERKVLAALDGYCPHERKTETGFGTAYCKDCPATFKMIGFNWVQR